MPVKLPEGQETTSYKVFMAHNQREALRETVAAYKKVSSYGNIASSLIHAIEASVDAGSDIVEAIASHDCKIKVRPVKGEDTTKVGVKFYFNDADMELLKELSGLAGMSRQDFLHIILFGTERPRQRKAAKGKEVVPMHTVSAKFDDDEFTVLTAANELESNGTRSLRKAIKEASMEWAFAVIERAETN